MGYVHKIFFVLASAVIISVQSHHTCSFTDLECTTSGAQKLLASVLQGSGDFTKPLDPMSLPDDEPKAMGFNYKVTNGTLTGVANCVFTVFKINPEDSTSRGEIICPELVLKYYYELYKGVGSTENDGAGSVTVTLKNYFVAVNCVFELYTSEKDNKLHLTFVKYVPTFEPKGPVSIDVEGPLNSDSIKDDTKEYASNTGLRDLEKILQVTQLPKYLEILMIATNNYLIEVPFDEVFQE